MLKKKIQEAPSSQRLSIIKEYSTVRPETDDWLHDWLHIYMGVKLPRTVHPECVSKGHVSPFTAFANAFFARDEVGVWKASRGFGAKTFNLSLLTLTEVITLGAYISLLGGSGEQAQRVNAYLNGLDPRVRGIFMDAPYAPRGILNGSFKREVRLKNGGLVRALMASAFSVRGPHPQRLRVDEVDEAEQVIVNAALGQPMEAGGVPTNIVLSSTHQHPDGPMTHYMKRARTEDGWRFYEWCYRENLVSNGGWLKDEEVAKKKKVIPQAMWDAEYEGQEPAPEDRIFSPDVLDNLFVPKLGVFEGLPGEDIVVIDPAELGDFHHGADWGKMRDFTVLHSERSGMVDELAAWIKLNRTVQESGREMKLSEMVGKFDERITEYGGVAAHDVTGMGIAFEEMLPVDVEGVNFSESKRIRQMYSNYITAIENGEKVYPEIKSLRDNHKLLTRKMVYGSDHVPDDIVAAALAHEAKIKLSGGLLIGRV